MKRSALALVAALSIFVAQPGSPAQASSDRVQGASSVPVCPGPAAAGTARCHARVVFAGKPTTFVATPPPTALGPDQIKAAYGWGSIGTGAGKTIAIVDAYDDPKAESDLGVFSTQYSLLPCTTANGCFKKVNQNGGTTYPRKDSGWALEISLDVQWAHAIAPGANILLVEATTNSFANLLAAEDYARQHADYVSNSWGGSEFSGESGYDSHFLSPSGRSVSFFVSSGDSDTPAEYPSASPNVISVGGTTLQFSNGAWTEVGWIYSGGGCSAYETATSAQSGFSQYAQVSCGGKRATPDVALDANPKSGVAVYDTVGYLGQTGWFQIGGTSASSPMWAARSAAALVTVDAAYVYGNSITYRDILSGSDGVTQSGCNTAGCTTGYDLSTGRGSWTH